VDGQGCWHVTRLTNFFRPLSSWKKLVSPSPKL
jgi:hypothetical protein